MHWVYRSLVFLAIALLFVAGFLGLDRAGALNSFQMTGGPGGGPPAQTQTASGAASGSPSAAFTMASSAATAAPASGLTARGPRGGRGGGSPWAGIGLNLAYVVLAWLALAALDGLARRRRPRTPASG